MFIYYTFTFKWTFKDDPCLWFFSGISCSDDSTLNVTQKRFWIKKIRSQSGRVKTNYFVEFDEDKSTSSKGERLLWS